MAITEQDFIKAEERAEKARQAGYAVEARYNRDTARIEVKLNTEFHFDFPARLAEGLADASPDDLAEIEISPSGLGLHWPKLDADLHVPGLLSGQLGSKRWMAAQLGAAGGRVRSEAKAVSSRSNGLRGGRPRKGAIPTEKAILAGQVLKVTASPKKTRPPKKPSHKAAG